MSSDAVITATELGKRYQLGERQQYGALRDVLAGGFRRRSTSGREELWALRDVSFTVGDGEVLGIIGRNGAGKSTLLKILSRITMPTVGEVRMRGRIGSLLEVGSGFHPELTGTENVFLNGAILGMSRHEIRAKLDEIVAFAEMDAFMSTPVKHYSVGMFMRLAFAVAAHLDAEILVVDEVLAVGDARFQQKCLAKMGEVARSGRSVLFVSHNLDATLALCDRGIVLEAGELVYDGDTRSAVDTYRRMAGVTTRSGDQLDLSGLDREGTGEARFESARIDAGARSEPARHGADDSAAVHSGDRLTITVDIDAAEAQSVASLGLTVGTEGGLMLLNLDSADAPAIGPIALSAGRNRLTLTLPELHLAPGRYRVGLRLANPVTTRIGSGAIDLLDPAFVLQVDEAPPSVRGDGSPEPSGTGRGTVATAAPVVHHGAGSLVAGAMVVECH
ncbi:MAG: ABC transporter ATP-binding protein [Actinomycetota bacterium]